MKKSFFFALVLASSVAISQTGRVGINTQDPKTTLDVVAKKGTTDVDGLLPPRLSLAELNSKAAGTYGVAQDGTIVYVTELGTATGTGQTAQISVSGYYYFDKNTGPSGQWVKFAFSNEIIPANIPTEPWRIATTANEAATNTQNIYQSGNVAIGSIFATQAPVMQGININTSGVATGISSSNYAKGWVITGATTPGGYLENLAGPSGQRVMKDWMEVQNGVNTYNWQRVSDNVQSTLGNILKVSMNNGFLGLGAFSSTELPTEQLDVMGNARIRGLVSGNNEVDFPYVMVVKEDGTTGRERRERIVTNAEHTIVNENAGPRTDESRFPLTNSQISFPIHLKFRNTYCQTDLTEDRRGYITINYRDGILTTSDALKEMYSTGTFNTLTYTGSGTNKIVLTHTAGQGCYAMINVVEVSYDATKNKIVVQQLPSPVFSGYFRYVANWVQ